MTNSPPHFSVEQLLHARQNGVPDYVIVPLLQKTIALKQAAAQQAALQAAPQKPPPIAQQVLGAAQQDQAREAGIAQLQAQQAIAQDQGEVPENYAGGGILAFAKGGGYTMSPEDIAQGEADFATPPPAQVPAGEDESGLDESIRYGQKLHNFLGESPANAEMQKVYEERQKGAEESKSKAPWLALMKAGAAMAQSKSPYFMSALGEGLGAGAQELEQQGESYDKQVRSAQDLKIQLAQAKRAEQLAIMNHGISSHEAILARKESARYTNELKAQRMAEQERHNRTVESQREKFGMMPYTNVTANTAANINATNGRVGAKGSGGGAGRPEKPGVNARAAMSATNSQIGKWMLTSEGSMANEQQLEAKRNQLYNQNLQILSTGKAPESGVAQKQSSDRPAFLHASKYE